MDIALPSRTACSGPNTPNSTPVAPNIGSRQHAKYTPWGQVVLHVGRDHAGRRPGGGGIRDTSPTCEGTCVRRQPSGPRSAPVPDLVPSEQLPTTVCRTIGSGTQHSVPVSGEALLSRHQL